MMTENSSLSSTIIILSRKSQLRNWKTNQKTQYKGDVAEYTINSEN